MRVRAHQTRQCAPILGGHNFWVSAHPFKHTPRATRKTSMRQEALPDVAWRYYWERAGKSSKPLTASDLILQARQRPARIPPQIMWPWRAHASQSGRRGTTCTCIRGCGNKQDSQYRILRDLMRHRPIESTRTGRDLHINATHQNAFPTPSHLIMAVSPPVKLQWLLVTRSWYKRSNALQPDG